MIEVENMGTDADTVVDYDSWLAHMKDTTDASHDIYCHDFDGVKYLAPITAGYLTAPVGIYKGKPVQAFTVMFSDIEEARSLLAAKGNILVYMLLFHTSRPVYQTVNMETLLPVAVTPYISQSTGWKLRYVQLD